MMAVLWRPAPLLSPLLLRNYIYCYIVTLLEVVAGVGEKKRLSVEENCFMFQEKKKKKQTKRTLFQVFLPQVANHNRRYKTPSRQTKLHNKVGAVLSMYIYIYVFSGQTWAGSVILPISSTSPVRLSYVMRMKGRLKVIRGGTEKSNGTSYPPPSSTLASSTSNITS